MIEKMPGILCTSLMPNNLVLQQKAVSSWRDAGFDVISVNCEEEISQLKCEFADVDFIKVNRDARKRHGKPLVYLDDVLAALKKTKAPITGIINSDIILRAPELSKKIKESIESRCFLGNRIDVQKIDLVKGDRYSLGYDYFIFDPKLLDKLCSTEFCLGMPWWDYWLPIAGLNAGFSTIYINTNIAYHEFHNTNWANDTFYRYGLKTKMIMLKYFETKQGKIIKQQLSDFISVYFAKDACKYEDAIRAFDENHTNQSILPSFAVALCAFIKQSADSVHFEFKS